MQTSSTSGIELQLENAPGPKGFAGPVLGGQLAIYILLSVPGVVVSLLPLGAYPPLDIRPVMGLMICLYLLPWTVYLFSILRKRAGNAAGLLRGVFIFSAVAVALLGASLIINGALDKFPQTELETKVVRKVVLNGRRATQYHIFVSSWRPGRSQEDFNVVQQVFNRARVGKRLTVEVHHGFLGLPWYGKISPE
jgi:hypothetical protein